MVTLAGYPVTYVEFFGTVSNLACVWLAARRHVLNWPIGILGVLFFGILFYEIRLYADFIEQIYFFITGVYGWWVWSRRSTNDGLLAKVSRGSRRDHLVLLGGVLVGTAALALLTARFHLIWPRLFPEPASYPWLDSFTTVLSFAAQILLVRGRLESWPLWILVDVIGIGLYGAKGVNLVAGLYAIFLVIAIRGFLEWYRASRSGAVVEVA